MFARRTIQVAAWVALASCVAWTGAAARAQTASSAPAPAAKPAPTAKPAGATKPAPATKATAPKPAPATKPAAKAAGPANIRFHFKDESYRGVVRFIARAAKKPIVGDLDLIQGKLTYIDAAPYTFAEAMGIVNQILRMKGYNLIDAGRYFKLVKLSALPQQEQLPIIVNGLDETPKRPDDEIVTAIVPLQYIEASQAVSLVARMVHSFGTLSRLGEGKGIIITDTVGNIRRIQRLLSIVDKGTLAKMQLKYYPIEHAVAADLARLIDQLFNAAQRGRRRFVFNRQTNRYEAMPVQPTETITITSDARSNTVVVNAAPAKHAMIEELIKNMDVAQAPGEGSVQIVKLKNTKAEDLAKTIIAAVGTKTITTRDRRGRTVSRSVAAARVVPDPSGNRLVVSAEPDVMRKIEKMIAELDGPDAERTGVRIFALKVANAASLVSVIQNAFSRRDRRGRSTSNLFVTADPRTNSLVVNGPAADVDGVGKLIEQLDKKTDTQQEIHVVRLEAGDARELARSLGRLLGQSGGRGQPATIRIEADRGTNSLIIVAAPGDWQRIEGFLAQLTKEMPAVTASVRIFALKHAKAADLATTLQRMFAPRRVARRSRAGAQEVPVVITHDTQANVIVASASGDDLGKIEKLITSLDVAPGKEALILVRSYSLSHTSAQNLARSLARLFAQKRQARGAPDQGPEPRFEAEANSNQLIVTATAEQFETIEKLIQSIQTDAAKDQTVVRKLFALKHAKAAELATTLQQIVQTDIAHAQRKGATRTRRGDVQVSVDKRTNSILVTAPADTMATIEELMPSLDAATTVIEVTQVIELTNADATELANAINAALAGAQAPPARRRRRGPPIDVTGLKGRKIVVVPAQTARALLVTGTKDDVAFAEKLIKAIDARPSTDKPMVKTFKVKHTKAEDLAGVLNATVAQMTGRRRGGVPTRITADKNANTLVVSAAGDVMERIAELLPELDVEGATEGAVTVEIVKLTKAKAADLATALNAAQGLDQRRRPRGRQGRDDETVRVTADAASNSLLLTGRPKDIAETKKLILVLDKAAGERTSEVRIVQLKQAKASEVVAVLKTILPSQSPRRRGAPSGPDVRIAAQDKANAVVIQAPPDVIALAEQIIKEFDRPETGATVIQIVTLTKAEATTLAASVNQALADQASRARGRAQAAPTGAVVIAEPNSNSVLVRGPKLEVEKAVELIKQLDKGGSGFATQVRVFPLEHAEAPLVAKTISGLFSQIIQQQRRRGGRNAPPPPSFSVAADERTNSLMIATSEANFTIVDALLKKMDSEAEASVRQVQYIPLLHADAEELATKIEAMFADRRKGDRPVVQADVLSNGITVIGKDADFRAIEAVVAKWDEAAEENYITVRVITLGAGVKAEEIAETLKRLYEQVSGSKVDVTDRLPERPAPRGDVNLFAPDGSGKAATQPASRRAATAPAKAEPAPVIIAVDKKSNSLIVSAPHMEIAEIEALVYQLTMDTAAADAVLKIFPVKNGDPTSIAKTLNALFNPKVKAAPRQPARRGQPAPAPAPKPKVLIAADVRTRSIIVRAKPVELEAIEPIIKQLDKASIVFSDVQVFPLTNTEAAEVAQNLRQLFQLSTPALPKGAKGAKGKQNQQLVRQMLELRKAEGLGQVDASAGVTVSANKATNSVIVAAPTDAMALITKLIEQLDQQPQAEATAVRMFKIQHAEVSEVVSAVTAIFSRRGRTVRGAKGKTTQAGGAVVAGNEAAKTVIVSARVDEFDLIEKVIKELDAGEPAAGVTVRVYRLQHADARSVADALTRTLTGSSAQRRRGTGAQPGAGGTRISPETTGNAIVVRAAQADHERIAKLITELDVASPQKTVMRTMKLVRSDGADVVNALNGVLRSWPRQRNQPRPTVSCNRATNTLVMSGTAEHIETIEAMVAALEDGAAKKKVETRFIPMANSKAADVARALGSFYGPRASRSADPADREVTIAADERSNALLVSATPEQFDAIATLIAKLDVADLAGDVRKVVIVLKNAQAGSVARAITQAFAPARGQRVAATDLVVATADTSTNTVIVSASEKNIQKVQDLVEELDKGTGHKAIVRTIQLTNADAREVSSSLGQMVWSWPRKANEPWTRVSFNRKTNSLIVSGTEENVKRVETMVEALEAAPGAKSEVRLLALANARADAVAQALGGFFGRRAASPAAPADREVTIMPDSRSGSLVISATPEQFKRIEALIGKLDVADAAGEGKQEVIRLTHAEAQSVAQAITRAFAPARGQRVAPEDLVTASAEPTTGSVIVSASAKNLEKIRALVKQIDTEAPGKRKIEFMILTKAKAPDIAKVLSSVISGRARGRTEEPPKISADASTNALVMMGKQADLEVLMAMAKQLDQVVEGKGPQVQILSLKNADAADVADAVSRVYREADNNARRLGQSIDPVAVSADPRSNVLIVAASAAKIKSVTQLVNQIDEMSPSKANLRVIQLQHANPDDVLKAIEKLFGSGGRGRVGRSRGTRRTGGVDATVLTEQRALLVSASDKDWEAIKALVAALDAAAAKTQREVLVFPLVNAPNTRVAAALNQMYRAAMRRGREEDRVSVVALAGTNAIVVTAAKEKMTEVGDLIKTLDGKKIIGPAEIRLFPLTNASAAKILPILNQLLTPMRQARPTQRIDVVADPRANTLIVSTQAPVLDDIAKIIADLDKVPPFKAAEMAIFPLKNADAFTMASVLSDMLTPGTSRIMTPEAKALQEQIRLLRLTRGKANVPALDLSKPIKITSDPPQRGQPGSNSLIVSSTADNIEAIGEIVMLLDTLPIAAGAKVQIIHLVNSDALSVMTLLREIFTQGRRLAGQPGTATVGKAKPENLVGEALTGTLNVTADARTNALIVAGTDESVALAVKIIDDLDRKPPSEFTEVKLFKLKHADAGRLSTLIRDIFAEQPSQVAGVAGARAYVTRLRVLREKRRPVESKVARSHPTMVVRAEAATNILIVAGRSDLIPIVDEVVQKMDVPGAGSLNVVRIYVLQEADASRMTTVINGLYTGPNANLIRPEDKPTITVDTRTNAMVVSASEKTFATIDALLRKLDKKLPIDLRDIRLVPLTNAEAATLAGTLQQMMDARVQRQQALGVKDAAALKMVITADDRSNILIVGGSAEGFKLVEDLAKRLDAAAPALGGKIQMVLLKNANAGSLSATLVNLFNQRYAAARTAAVRRQKPVIVPDLRINALLVSANADDSKVLTGLVRQLDAKPVHPAVELVVLPMKFNDAGAVGPMIQRIFADRLRAMTPQGQQIAPQDIVSVATDALSNALVVSASKDNLVFIRSLLAKVDVEPPTDTGVVKMYYLKHASVARVAALLQTLLQQGLYKPALVAAGDNAIARAREKVAIASDLRTNVLIISASKENFAVIDEIIRKVDVAEGWGLVGSVKIYLLENADAVRLGPTLQQVFDRKRAAEAAASGAPSRTLPIVIAPDERTNALLVAGSKEDMKAMDALVKQLDVAEVTQTHDFKIFYLKRASAAALEPTLRQLFAQRRPRGRAATAVTIIADPKANALIIGAEKDDLAIAESLIARLDQAPPKEGQAVRVFPIVKADAAQLANTLRQLYEAQKATGGASGIAITVDERSNAILVSAAEADMEAIANLVAKLDTAAVTDVTEIRIFTLRHADATQLGTILTNALTNKPKAMGARSPSRVTLLRFISRMPDGKKLMDSALKEGVMITPISQTNSLLVEAPADTMTLLDRLIRALDTTSPRMAEIRVISLTNADATQMARVLTELFKLQVVNTQRQAARYTIVASPTGAGEAVGKAAPAATLGSAEQTALTITVDRRTNSLLVGGTREYVELVERVIQELDSSPAEDRQTVVYRLRHAQAPDIEQALRTFLDQERDRIRSTLGADAVEAAKNLLAREIAVVAEETSNTLLVSGSPRFFKTVAAIIRELDQPPPQVLVQVLLAEVTLDDTMEFGVEWSHVGRPQTGKTTQAQTSFGLGADGFTFSLSGGDLTLLLRSLQTQGRLEVLSRPQILAADNQQAQINVGQRVPFVTASRVTDTGGTYNTISYEDVGIILDVTPHISPDGFVTMEVNPEVSSVADSSVQISENLNAIVVNSRSAQTTVTVQDGHTVVMGGLITNRNQNREEKIPLLGDIPILGALFKYTRNVKERTELLIVLTPRILRTPMDADILSNRQIRQLRLSRGLGTDASIGELLNPLRGITALEVKRLEAATRPAAPGPVVIPLTLTPEERKELIDNKAKPETAPKTEAPKSE